MHGISALGFSHVEIGTVTPRPQPGNPKPRLFRLTEDAALINRMGFPSSGMVAMVRNLRRIRGYDRPILISLGKNKATELVDAHQDYGDMLSVLYPYGDLFTINVSSPNTPDLRRLQTQAYLSDLLAAVAETLAELSGGRKPKPLLIKIAPDLTHAEIDALLDVALQHHVAGIVATNTTIQRDRLRSPNGSQEGGLSGQPLRERSTAIIHHIYHQTEGKLPIIGIGGIFNGDDLYEKLQAGATLAQAYTGFIYEGPAFVQKCIRGLRRRMAADGVTRLDEIIGVSAIGRGARK
jgi:dihydroorotate dehydrogenase